MKSEFIISIHIIAKHSTLLEPIVNIPQSKSLDLLQHGNHIKKILPIVQGHCKTADAIMKDLFVSSLTIAVEILI